MIDLSDRIVVITGAGRGIGRTIAGRFAEQRSCVVALDVDATALKQLRADGFDAQSCDVADAADVEQVMADVATRHGRIDVLVNNAGINVVGQVTELDAERWDRAFAVNTRGVFNTCRAVAPVMKAQRAGRIINAASFAVTVPSVASAAYAASKAAVVALTRVLASELGPWDVTVNAYAPGMVPSAMNGFGDLPADAQDELLDTLSLRRWGTADEIADAVCFLASDLARYTTGTMLDVSGGKLATQRPQVAHHTAG